MKANSVLETIGNTPHIRVGRLFPDAEVWVKSERANPGGSIKDRIALAMVEAAEADGRLNGDLHLETVQCDQTANVCNIKVPAPGFALVFMSDQAAQESEPASTATFATTAVTKYKNTATIDPAVLATSNGNRGMGDLWGSTSFGSNAAPGTAAVLPSLAALAAMAAGAAA